MQKAIFITIGCLLSVLPMQSQDRSTPKPAEKATVAKLDSKWATFAGEWAWEGSGSPGNGAGSSSFQFDLQRQVPVRRSHSDILLRAVASHYS